MNYTFKILEKISKKESKKLISDMILYGESGDQIKNKNIEEAKRKILERGLDFESEVERCRTFSKNVCSENLLGNTWGGGVSIVDCEGRTIKELKGPGEIYLYQYRYIFDESLKQFKMSIKDKSYSTFLSSLTSGIASIEGFINEMANNYNKNNPKEPLIDNKKNKVSLDDKINKWVPKICEGKKFDKSTIIWEKFKYLQSIRDTEAVHLKGNSYGISYRELVSLMNQYRFGIAKMLFKLHIIFKENVPSNIVRTCHFPEIVLVQEDIDS